MSPWTNPESLQTSVRGTAAYPCDRGGHCRIRWMQGFQFVGLGQESFDIVEYSDIKTKPLDMLAI